MLSISKVAAVFLGLQQDAFDLESMLYVVLALRTLSYLSLLHSGIVARWLGRYDPGSNSEMGTVLFYFTM